MNDDKKTKKIKCAVFQTENKKIEKLTKAINTARDVEIKARFAEKLQELVNVLLFCEKFDDESPDCKICHLISNLRRRTANLIIKAKELKY